MTGYKGALCMLKGPRVRTDIHILMRHVGIFCAMHHKDILVEFVNLFIYITEPVVQSY